MVVHSMWGRITNGSHAAFVAPLGYARPVTSLDALDSTSPVSVVMAMRNEEHHLERAVASVLENGFAPGVELVIAVGPSADATADVAAALARDPRVTVVANPAGTTPHGLNIALELARRDVVVRMDGHGELPPGYIEAAVAALERTGAANVGGRMVPDAEAPFARAVATAMKSRWGIGGAGHRIGGEPGPADSVFLGVFRKEALAAVGGFDEHFIRAQDWELNYRLRRAGYAVWFEPAMQVAYRPRGSWRSLARQFHDSGRWRREVVRTHPGTASVRYLAPPLVALALALGVGLGAAGLVADSPWLLAGWAAPAAYLAGVLIVAGTLVPRCGWRAGLALPVVLPTMHLAWGTGFLRGVA